ncbi:MAG: hypothetical protein OXD38_12545 [Aestuariivita sp.]|nr:hypothetical protein [Aestuariivita sp.]
MQESNACPTKTIEELVFKIRAVPTKCKRRLIAIAGPPTAGKSTLAETLQNVLNKTRNAIATTVPMDGFHLDNRLLALSGLQKYKGSPETFDVDGFVTLVKRLTVEDFVYYPIFDRTQDQAIAGSGVVTPDCETIVIEGNYLLFDEPLWSELVPFWDFSIWIDVDEEEIRNRCMQRWVKLGLSEEEAKERTEQNDLRNTRRIMNARVPANYVVV